MGIYRRRIAVEKLWNTSYGVELMRKQGRGPSLGNARVRDVVDDVFGALVVEIAARYVFTRELRRSFAGIVRYRDASTALSMTVPASENCCY